MPTELRRVERPPACGRRVLWLALATGLALGCGSESESRLDATRSAPGVLGARFDAERAFADLRELVAIGPRPSGSQGAARARGLIGERLRQAGWQVREQPFSVVSPAGESVEMRNVLGVQPGRRSERILVVTHYDTKRIPGVRFVGANDGASGVALMLELARQLGSAPREYTYWLVFFDGEEAFGRDITAADGLYGSRWLADRLQDGGELESIRALVLVDMIADADLNLARDLTSSPRLWALLEQAASETGQEHVLEGGPTLPVLDDHTPFARLGVEEVLALIDFQFGERRTPGSRWHTARDDLASVSVESLNSVGVIVVELLETIEDPATGPHGSRNETLRYSQPLLRADTGLKTTIYGGKP